MDNFNTIANKQIELGENLDKSRRNYKKDSSTRKTAEYLQKKKQAVKELWAEFEKNHAILKSYENTETHAYFANKYYEAIQNIYTDFIEDLNERLNENASESAILQEPMNKSRENAAASPNNQFKIQNEQEQATTSKLFIPPALANKSTNNQPKIQLNSTNQCDQQLLRKYEVRKNALLKIMEKVHTETQTASESMNECNPKVKTLNDQWTAFNQIYEDVQINYSTTEYEDEYEFIEEKYFELTTMIMNRGIVGANGNNTRNANIEAMSLKLKPINITTFSGEYRSWPTFKDLFSTLIHNNRAISNVQKMQYLKTNVTGDASKIINHLSITEENYESAWHLLLNRYENKRMIATNYLDTLISQPTMYQESAKQLKGLHDTTKECVHGLKEVSKDAIILHILTKKLDKETHKQYENSLKNPKELQSLENFLSFIENRFQTLETVGEKKEFFKTTGTSQKGTKVHLATTFEKCAVCNQQHRIQDCKVFQKKSFAEKNTIINEKDICRNCLKTNHKLAACPSKYRCSTCNGKHHSLMHVKTEVAKANSTPSHVSTNDIQTTSNGNINVHLANKMDYNVLLATALIRIEAKHGGFETLRALIDQGSMATFISEEAAQRLQLPRNKKCINISGIGSSDAGTTKGSVQLNIKSRYPSSFSLMATAMILNKLTKWMPEENFEKLEYGHTQDLVLADPSFNKSGKIDIIFGADVFAEIILPGVIKGKIGTPVAQETEFGWILSGRTKQNTKQNKMLSLVAQIDLDEELKKFWEIEEVQSTPKLSAEDMECEMHFQNTHTRAPDGRYIVKLPFKENTPNLGNSRKAAMAQLFQLERRFARNPELRQAYVSVMEEFLTLHHMSECQVTSTDENSYYLPHHAVMKESSTTQVRVVFDGSRKTTSGISLNDKLLVGPRLQEDLINIVIRFRSHKIAFSADIAKMYRQILINQEHTNFQKILWRKTTTEPIKEYNLQTVTYGTASAPFLAIRTLMQHAENEAKNHPIVSSVIKRDFYVDDLLSGCASEEEAIQLQKELCDVLSNGGFDLRKWSSNSSRLLHKIPEEQRELKSPLDLSFDNTVKTLGLLWHSSSDEFGFKIQPETPCSKLTKRAMLSDISKLFDPLGLLAPVIITAKIMLQNLWLASLKWDDPLPSETEEKWLRFRQQLPEINNIKLKRWIQYMPGDQIELHGFSDASILAYSAVVYAKITDKNNQVFVNIISSKTRVAPLKQISLPKLELCGAVLVTKLLDLVKKSLSIDNVSCFAWTDSEIVLAWIRAQPNRWKTFVANRVATIQETIEPQCWKHVPTKDNPADCASRGLQPNQLKDHLLWWHGPDWLQQSSINWPMSSAPNNITLEQRNIKISCVAIKDSSDELLFRYSTLTRLKRITAYCLRFINNLQKSRGERTTGPLTVKEIHAALICSIKHIQSIEFKKEIEYLKLEKGIPNQSTLKSLNPFLDKDGLLRVGGRLQHAENIGYNAKFPILLPHKHQLTQLIVSDIHLATLHGGPQLMLNTLRKRYWIPGARKLLSHHMHHCVICCRQKGETTHQLMGNLPKPRITPSRPFSNCGVDYCGPFTLRTTRGRGNQKTYKGYVAIFICFATKAVHIELVSDMTTDAFLAAYRRFISRRGKCKNIYSDNGTCFVGANNELRELRQLLLSQQHIQTITNNTANDETTWHFIPPGSPHFGGLWEAGVKSIKYHLKRITGSTIWTFEEMYTLLTQIEACLNSRPLTTLTDDPSDLQALTPGHFLVGSELISCPEPDLTDIKINRLSRWQLIQQQTQHFWKRWQSEYLSRLQQRPKWMSSQPELKINQLVLIKDENLPPTKWSMGRITDTHAGQDGHTRVVTVKTTKGIIQRPATKICLLPVAVEDENLQKLENDTAASTDSTANETTFSKPKGTVTKTLPSKGMYLIMIFFGLLAAVVGKESVNVKYPIQTTPFNTEPGIYFEKMGAVRLTSNQWKLVVFYDLKPYHAEIQLLKTNVNHIDNFCKKSHDLEMHFDYCHSILPQFKHHLQELEERNTLITQRNKKQRTKRVVGVIAGALIGGAVAGLVHNIMGESSAEKYADDIMKCKNNEDHLLQLLKNQTSILEATTNVMKKQSLTTNNQIEQMSKQVVQLYKTLLAIQEQGEQDRVTHLLTMMAIQFSLVLTGCQNTQNALLNVILDINNGKISPLLLSPKQLQNQLDLIRANLADNVKTPEEGNEEELLQIYKILTAKARVMENYIIVEIMVPLISQENYELFHLVPVPTPHNNTFVWIEPTTEYLIVNLQREQYYPIQQLELNECMIFHQNTYMCRQQHTLYMKASNFCRCEMNILNHEKDIHPSCTLKSTKPSKMWIQLQQPNSWIYVMDQEHYFDVICAHEVYPCKLNGSGIMTLEPNCQIKQSTMIISSRNIYTSQVSTAFVPSTNLSQQLTMYESKAKTPFPVLNVSTIVTNGNRNIEEEIGKLQRSIATLHQNENVPLERGYNLHDIHHYSIVYIAISFCIGIYIYKKYYNKKPNHNNFTV